MDLVVIKYISQIQNALATVIFKLITSLGDFIFIFAASAILIIWLLWRRRLEEALIFGAGIFFAGLLAQFLKLLIGRIRPPDGARALEAGYSFPSGHALGATVFYGFLLFLIMRYSKNLWTKKVFSVALPLLILLIGASRVYLGVHWASDAVAGWVIGGAILFGLIKIINYAENTKS